MNKRVFNKLEYNKIIDKLISHTISPMGKELSMALSPVTDIEEVRNSQKETKDALSMILKKGNIPLGGIKDIRASLKRVAVGATLTISELLYVSEVLRVTSKAKAYSKNERGNEEINCLNEMFRILEPLTKIQKEISFCIISEEAVADNASPGLRNVRKDIKNASENIKQQLQNILHSSSYKNMLQDSVITMRDNRYCVPVKQEYRGSFKGMIHDQSQTGSTLFIEPMAIVNLNNKLKELEIKEKEEIEKILRDLTGLVAESVDQITVNLEILTKLDFVFAKANLAIAMNGTEPIFNTKGYINLKKARHPLLDPDEVVPIDVHLGKDFTTLMITGPNTGGKTVTLKTLGLFTLMGQAGLHIPAFDRSELAIFSKIFADIGDEQSIEQSLSTFSSHMVNIVKILEEVNSDSLVLFDEIGAGTDPTEGAALATAILQSLHQRKIRTVATTHYSELKVYALSTEGVENASCEFDVNTLSPTYKLLVGVPGKSNAFAISRRLGLKEDLITKAKGLLEQEEIRFEDVITDLEISKKTVIIEQERAKKYRLEAEQLKKKVEERKEKIEQQRDRIISEAKEEARKILQVAKDDADNTVKTLNKIAKDAKQTLNYKEIEKHRTDIRTKLKDVENQLAEDVINAKVSVSAPKNLKLGDPVYVTTFNQEGVVVQVPDSKGDVMVQLGIMKMKVNIKNLSLLKANKVKEVPKNRKTGAGKVKVSKSQTTGTEINVLGMTVDEAVGEIDKYIDDAYLANLSKITIIHGKGTGALRIGIHKYLRKNSHVKTYRLGVYGEGENGVTIIEIN